MTARQILQTFDVYRVARMSFVQTVAELALRPQNVEVMVNAGILDLLKPLLNDVCVQVQQCAAVALGRVAHHADIAANRTVLPVGILSALLQDLPKRNKHYKRAAMFALRSACRHGTQAAEALLAPGTGTLDALMFCLVEIDTGVREAAAWAAGYIARSSPNLAKAVVDAGAIPHLVLCLQEPELSVRRVAASALADIARHSSDLAAAVLHGSAVGHLARACLERDDHLKRQALLALASVARQSRAAAEAIVQAELFPDTLSFLVHRCPLVRRNAAMLVRDVVRHTPDLAQLVVNTGGVGALVEALKQDPAQALQKVVAEADDHRVPTVAALGYIAGHGSQLALCIVNCDGVSAVKEAMTSMSTGCELKSVGAWCLGQIGRSCPEQVAASGVLPMLLELSANSESSEELRSRCHAALRMCVQGCQSLSALQPLMHHAPPDLLKYVLGQITKILPNDPLARRLFVTSGGLKRVQEIEAEPGSSIMEYITLINACFPEEIVRYYTPGYPDLLLEKVEQFKPNLGEDEIATKHLPSQTVSRELDMLFND